MVLGSNHKVVMDKSAISVTCVYLCRIDTAFACFNCWTHLAVKGYFEYFSSAVCTEVIRVPAGDHAVLVKRTINLISEQSQ